MWVLLLGIGLAWAPSPAVGDARADFGAHVVVDGLPLRRQLPRCQASWLGMIDVPEGAAAFVVGVHASHDVDLYLTHGAPPACPFDAHADASSRSSSSFEAVRLAASGTRPLRAGRWFITIANPNAGSCGARFEVFAAVDTEETGHTVLPGRPLDIRRALAGGRVRLRTWLPEGATDSRLQIQGLARGATHKTRGPHDHELQGLLSGPVTLSRARLPAGVWTVEVEGRPNKTGQSTVARTALGIARARDRGTHGLASLSPTAAHMWRLDRGEGLRRILRLALVAPRWGPAIFVSARAEGGGEVDLAVRREGPPRRGIHDADWFARGANGMAGLMVGGPKGLAGGRFVLEVIARTDASGQLAQRIAISRSLEAFAPDGFLPDGPLARLDEGLPRSAWRDVVIPARAGSTRFALEVPAGVGSIHVQTAEPSHAVDLVLERWADGRVVARALGGRVAERLDYAFPSPLPGPRRFVLRVLATRAADTRLRLAWELGGPPALPADLAWPPFMSPVPEDGETRAAAATVEIAVRGGTSGSGTCIHEGGWILTSRHVLEPHGEEGRLQRDGIWVAFPRRLDEAPVQAFEATLIADDPDLDLALLRITRDVWGRALAPDLSFPTAPLREGDAPDLGAPVLVIGYPTVGGTARRAPVVLTPGVVTRVDAEAGGVTRIRSDTWVATGHSGGGLFDAEGRVAGVVVARVEPGSRAALGLSVGIRALPPAWLTLLQR